MPKTPAGKRWISRLNGLGKWERELVNIDHQLALFDIRDRHQIRAPARLQDSPSIRDRRKTTGRPNAGGHLIATIDSRSEPGAAQRVETSEPIPLSTSPLGISKKRQRTGTSHLPPSPTLVPGPQIQEDNVENINYDTTTSSSSGASVNSKCSSCSALQVELEDAAVREQHLSIELARLREATSITAVCASVSLEPPAAAAITCAVAAPTAVTVAGAYAVAPGSSAPVYVSAQRPRVGRSRPHKCRICHRRAGHLASQCPFKRTARARKQKH
jgi:hypothetical protein